MIKRLAAVLDVPRALAREVDEHGLDPLTPITVKTAVHDDQVYYLQEHASEFPASRFSRRTAQLPVSVARRAVPRYVGESRRGTEGSPQARSPTTAEATKSASQGWRPRSTATYAGSRARADPRGLAWAAQSPSRSGGTPARAPRFGSRSTCACSARQSRRSGRASRSRRPTSSSTSPAARSLRSTRATVPCARWRRVPPTSHPSMLGASTRRSSRRS